MKALAFDARWMGSDRGEDSRMGYSMVDGGAMGVKRNRLYRNAPSVQNGTTPNRSIRVPTVFCYGTYFAVFYRVARDSPAKPQRVLIRVPFQWQAQNHARIDTMDRKIVAWTKMNTESYQRRWLLVGTILAVAITQQGCSMLNRTGPEVTCEDMKGGLINACEESVIARCTNGKMTYEVCDSSFFQVDDVCEASWQIPNAYRCTKQAKVPVHCGDGRVSSGEECDDGNPNDGDGCDSNCTKTSCGNGVLTDGEVCDDGNLVDGDGCDSNCTQTECGNGVKTQGESCDDGNLIDGDGCEANCKITGCGDGNLSNSEICDDGNLVDGDGCDSNCTMTACGNGIVTDGEMCDDGNSVDDDECANNCIPTRCGNGQLTNGELCDDGNLVSGDGCDSNCTPTACGNGVVTSGEQCDDGNLHDGDGCDSNCTSTACGNGIQTDGEDCDDGGMTASCNDDCTFSSCGDGRLNVQSGEECDDANNTDDDACDGFCSRMSVIKGAPGHVCWLRADNSMRCWGNNIDGQLGDGTTVSSGTPVAVSVADGAIGLASFGLFTGSLGDEYKGTTCALRSEGKVACWGNGEYGQLGNGSMVNSINPVYAAGLTGTVAVAAGGLRACALRFDGTVRCWGFGIGPTPLDVAGLTGVIQLAVGAQHACAVLKGGGVQCWGRNVEGQLGNGTESPSTTPVTVIGITGAISTSVGFDHSCAVMSSGEVWCWGANWEGQLGDGTTTNRSQAQPVASLSDAFSVSAGYNSTCALTGSGTAFCWGTDHSGSLGNDSQQMAQSSPVPVLGIIDATNITTSGDQSYFGSINGYSAAYGCALTSDGSAKCWGENGSFQLGDGTQNDSFTPVTVLGNPLNFANGIPPSFP